MDSTIKIDIWSDIACPWCYIGKRRLEAGLAAFADLPASPPVGIEYHSFQLSPDTPGSFDGSAIDFLVQNKHLPVADVKEMLARVTGIARSLGLDYDYDALRHANTLKAHQLLHYAKSHGVQLEAKERLLSAYFVEGRHVGHDEELADLAADLDLDRSDVLRSLRDGDYLDAVRADQQMAMNYGIRGVPFYVIDGRYGISGAQPAEIFTQALVQVSEDRSRTSGRS